METTELLTYKNAIGQMISKGDWVAWPAGEKKKHSPSWKSFINISKRSRYLMIVQVGSFSQKGYSIAHRRLHNILAVTKVEINEIDLNYHTNRLPKILKTIIDLEVSLK